MSYEQTLELLADPTRRSIVEKLRCDALPVGEIAFGLPVSRPAVSKHLKLMLDAGLVSMREDGTRNLYQLDVRGLASLRSYVESFWDDALQAFTDYERRTRP